MAEPTTPELLPPVPPLLALIRNVAVAIAASSAGSGKSVRVRDMEPLPDGMALAVEAQGINFLLDGNYRVEVAVLRTSRESTLCDVRIAEGRVVGRLLNWGRKLLPDALLNGLLQGKAGGALRMEGDRVAIDHAALIKWALKK
jgi:hypothetical protein